MKISIAKIQKPRARLTRQIPVEILCRACRLITQSGVSTFDSDARANLRLKLAVASIGFSFFDRRLQWAFPVTPSSSRAYQLQREKRRYPSEKIFYNSKNL